MSSVSAVLKQVRYDGNERIDIKSSSASYQGSNKTSSLCFSAALLLTLITSLWSNVFTLGRRLYTNLTEAYGHYMLREQPVGSK